MLLGGAYFPPSRKGRSWSPRTACAGRGRQNLHILYTGIQRMPLDEPRKGLSKFPCRMNDFKKTDRGIPVTGPALFTAPTDSVLRTMVRTCSTTDAKRFHRGTTPVHQDVSHRTNITTYTTSVALGFFHPMPMIRIPHESKHQTREGTGQTSE